MRGTRYDPRPAPPAIGERLLLVGVVVALVLAVGFVYVRALVALLERVSAALS